MKSKRRCLLIPSGNSILGSENRFCGFTDPPLSNASRNEVLRMRDTIKNSIGSLPQVWYVSDRRRAMETFEAITAGAHAPVVRIKSGLREMNFGEYENLTWEELPGDFQRHYEYCMAHPDQLEFPSGENFLQMCERVSSCALEIFASIDEESEIGIIGHQGSLRMFMLIQQDKPLNEFFNLEPPRLGNQGEEFLDLELSLVDIAKWRQKHLVDVERENESNTL